MHSRDNSTAQHTREPFSLPRRGVTAGGDGEARPRSTHLGRGPLPLSLDALWNALNDPKRHPTSRPVVDAIMHCVIVRGVAALKEPANAERISRCDQEARAEIKRRISALRGRP